MSKMLLSRSESVLAFASVFLSHSVIVKSQSLHSPCISPSTSISLREELQTQV